MEPNEQLSGVLVLIACALDKLSDDPEVSPEATAACVDACAAVAEYVSDRERDALWPS